METKNWKWFEVANLFDKPYKGTAYNAQNLEICDFDNKKAIRYVTRTDTNNGLKNFVINEEFEDVERGNAITIGDTTSTIYYQAENFICGDHIVILRSKFLNKLRGLFLVSLLNMERYRYNYGRAYKKDLIYHTKIKLPIDSNGNPDWQWIENYVQNTLIPQLPQKTKNVWQKTFDTKPLLPNKLQLNTKEWQWFRVGDLFGNQKGIISKCKCSSASELLEDGKDIAYIGAKKSDNGIMKYVQLKEDLVTKGNCMVFIGDGQGSVGYSLYQPNDFIGSTTLFAGYNENLNKYNAMFLIAVLDQERYRYSYGRKYKPSDTKLKLPAIKNAQSEYEPDWQWMEDYIKSLPYSGCL